MRSTSFEAYRSPLRPSGTGAFVPPSPPYPGKRYATGFSAIPPQAADPLTRTLGLASDLPCDEDCLYLHVYSVGVEATSVGVEATSVGVEATGPGRAALRPVLVWLHGGAFLSGTGNVPLYDGSRLAERGDVVVVTLNYRVGALGFLYVDALSGGSGGATANDLFYAIQTDIALRRPATELAEAHARIQPNTYMYLFTWASPFQNGELEACHALDLPFAFGTLDAPGIAAFAGSGSAARRLSENMMEAWLSFACCGDPAHPGIGPWPRYDAKRRATMLFGEMSGAEDAPLESERAVWDLVR